MPFQKPGLWREATRRDHSLPCRARLASHRRWEQGPWRGVGQRARSGRTGGRDKRAGAERAGARLKREICLHRIRMPQHPLVLNRTSAEEARRSQTPLGSPRVPSRTRQPEVLSLLRTRAGPTQLDRNLSLSTRELRRLSPPVVSCLLETGLLEHLTILTPASKSCLPPRSLLMPVPSCKQIERPSTLPLRSVLVAETIRRRPKNG